MTSAAFKSRRQGFCRHARRAPPLQANHAFVGLYFWAACVALVHAMSGFSDTLQSATDQASELAERAMEQGREVSAIAQKAPGAMREAVDTSLKQQPMITLAVAGALGFLLGALWKS